MPYTKHFCKAMTIKIIKFGIVIWCKKKSINIVNYLNKINYEIN